MLAHKLLMVWCGMPLLAGGQEAASMQMDRFLKHKSQGITSPRTMKPQALSLKTALPTKCTVYTAYYPYTILHECERNAHDAASMQCAVQALFVTHGVPRGPR